MPRSINEIQHIRLAVQFVIHLDGMALDCDSALALEIHVVKHLCLEILFRHRFGEFQKTVGQGAFAVVYMGYYAAVSDIFHSRDQQRERCICSLVYRNRLSQVAGNIDIAALLDRDVISEELERNRHYYRRNRFGHLRNFQGMVSNLGNSLVALRNNGDYRAAAGFHLLDV